MPSGASFSLREVLASFWLLAAPLFAQVYPAGPQVLTFFSTFDDSDQPYGLYLPRTFDSSRSYPLVVSLHGEYSNHRLNLRRILGRGNRPGETDTEASRYFPPLPDVDFIIATPFSRGTLGYRGLGEDEVYQVLDDVKRRFKIDEDRIYLTGLSMGGDGALWLALTRPHIWAAVAAVCPQPSPAARELAPNGSNLVFSLFHGIQDPLVPVAVSREWKKTFEAAGIKAELTEYPTVRHNAWDHAYRNTAIFPWFSQFKRNRFPESIHYRTNQNRYTRSYWTEITGMTSGEWATIDATFNAANRVRIKTSGIDGFRLLVEGHPQYRPAQTLELDIDGTVLKTKALSFSKKGSAWTAQPFTPPLNTKHAGQEGPLIEAISERHIYVYGTEGSPGKTELEWRQRQAASAAEWSSTRARVVVQLRIVADRDLSETDFRTSNLVLFGTRETNSVIRRLGARLPFHLNAGAADYGLLYIWPNGDRSVIVNSGLPFTTGSEFNRKTPLQLLAPLGDFVLFRESLDNIVVEGRFDQQWRVPAQARSALLASGAIEAH
jgi:pimeloyl-ACP methyl ester carboxylesterase